MAQRTNNGHAGLLTRYRGWLVALALIVGVVLLAAFVSLRGSDIPVRATTVVRGTIRATISTNGKVEPVQNFEAHALAPASVRRVLVHEGDHVKPGQPLLQLDDSDARAQAAKALAQLRSAESALEAIKGGGSREEVLTTQAELVRARTDRDVARRNLDAMRRLEKKGDASKGEINDAENQLQRAESQVNLLEQKLKDRYSTSEVGKVQAQETEGKAAYAAAEDMLRNSNIRAPRAGIVYSLPVREGAFVNTGDLLIQVADTSSVQVRAFVDEPDIGRLSPGERVEITWDALPGRIWRGNVKGVPVAVQLVGTRNVGQVTCAVDNHDMKLLPNVNVNVTIVTGEHRNVLTLPREAVHQDGGKPYVFQIVDGVLRRQAVSVGISNLTLAEVSGLPENSQVALGALNGQPLAGGLAARPVQ
ncbi:MAG TPA: efflux RND transporter periplasmic adaptor subunit [Terriglobales bacterium]|nr:efflux RND transporter periplasmic adaptor subunit [Terriglobales bacterium]